MDYPSGLNDEYPTSLPEFTDPGPQNHVPSAQQFSQFNLTSEDDRLKTFLEFGWSPYLPKTPSELAENGFYFLGDGDKVKCAFCGIVLHQWKREDDILNDHAASSANCSFVKQLLIKKAQSANASGLKHPQYDTIQKRYDTFINWPASAVQTPWQLADAGFFYTGQGDKVKCFSCGGNLKDWEPNDIPHLEHAKFYKNCEYIKNYRQSNPVVFEAPVTHATLQSGGGIPPPAASASYDAPRHLEHQQAQSGIPPPAASASYHTPRQLERQQAQEDISESVSARMDTPIVQAVLQRGHSKDSVEKALKKQLTTTGDDFPNVAALMQAIEDVENDIYSGENDEHNFVVTQRGPSGSAYQQTYTDLYQANSQASKAYGYPDFEAQIGSSVPSTKIRSRGLNTGMSLEYAGEQTFTMDSRRPDNITTQQTIATRSAANAPNLANQQNVQAVTDIPNDLSSLKKGYEELMNDRTCKICMENISDIVFLPCGHMVACASCASEVRNCPICRQPIQSTVRTFMS